MLAPLSALVFDFDWLNMAAVRNKIMCISSAVSDTRFQVLTLVQNAISRVPLLAHVDTKILAFLLVKSTCSMPTWESHLIWVRRWMQSTNFKATYNSEWISRTTSNAKQNHHRQELADDTRFVELSCWPKLSCRLRPQRLLGPAAWLDKSRVVLSSCR